MSAALDRTAQALGDGSVVTLGSGDVVFKLSSFEDNPIVKPQDIGLTWQENGETRIGAVFNGGAEMFEGQVILMPRCHRGYQKKTFFDAGIKNSYPILVEVAPGDIRCVWGSGTADTPRTHIRFDKLRIQP